MSRLLRERMDVQASVELMMRTGFRLFLGAVALVVITRFDVFASAPKAVVSAVIAPGTASIAFACFVADEQDSGAIYRITTDGSALQALAPQVHAARAPDWSRDGRSLVFQGNRDNWLAKLMNFGGNEELYVIRDGSNLHQLTDNWNADLTPAWSPDGQWLAFVGLDAFAGQNVYRMRADGSDRRQLTSGLLVNPALAWSADGQQIAFTTSRIDGTRWLYTINADGRERNHLISDKSIKALAWSADGQWIGYQTFDGLQTRVSVKGDTVQYLYFNGDEPVWSDTRPSTEATGPIKPVALLRPTDFSVRAVVHVPIDVTSITESPDGQWIAYTSQSYAPGPVFAQLFKQRVDGSTVQQLTQMPCNAYDPSWSPAPPSLD